MDGLLPAPAATPQECKMDGPLLSIMDFGNDGFWEVAGFDIGVDLGCYLCSGVDSSRSFEEYSSYVSAGSSAKYEEIS